MLTRLVGSLRFSRVDRLRAVLVSLVLGVLVAILLLLFLSTVAAVSAPEGNYVPVDLDSATSLSTATSSTTTVHVTKTVKPNPFYTSGLDPGGPVSICFTVERRGLDLVLVHDVSGSMREWLAASEVVASDLVSYLQKTDRAAVVPFSTTACLTRSLTRTKSKILRAVGGLTAGGYTNMGGGISVSHQELVSSSRYVTDTIKAILLLSDGGANCDENGHCKEDEDTEAAAAEYARQRATAAADDGIKIYTIGFGSDPNVVLLKELAEIGHGQYFFAPSVSFLEPIYLTIALELHNLVITDVLTAGVDAHCPQGAPYSCGGSTVTWPVSDNSLITNPLTLCFGATVDLGCNYRGLINDPDESGFCYQNAGRGTVCGYLDNPVFNVICRKVYMPIVMSCYSSSCSPGIVNGDFELGQDRWADWMHGGKLSRTITSADPHSGSFSARLGDPAYKCSSEVPVGCAWMEQTILVPCTGSPKLIFWYSITTYDCNNSHSNEFDLFEVTINSVQVFKDMPPADGHGCQDPPKMTGWVSKTVDLGEYRGSCITIRFVDWNRPLEKYNTWTYVDDVRIDH